MIDAKTAKEYVMAYHDPATKAQAQLDKIHDEVLCAAATGHSEVIIPGRLWGSVDDQLRKLGYTVTVVVQNNTYTRILW